jgi:hypothetical protein
MGFGSAFAMPFVNVERSRSTEQLLILGVWLWNEFHVLIITVVAFWVLWYFVVRPIRLAISSIREEKDNLIRD